MSTMFRPAPPYCFGEDQPRPAELGHLLPLLVGVAALVLHHLAHVGHRRTRSSRNSRTLWRSISCSSLNPKSIVSSRDVRPRAHRRPLRSAPPARHPAFFGTVHAIAFARVRPVGTASRLPHVFRMVNARELSAARQLLPPAALAPTAACPTTRRSSAAHGVAASSHRPRGRTSGMRPPAIMSWPPACSLPRTRCSMSPAFDVAVAWCAATRRAAPRSGRSPPPTRPRRGAAGSRPSPRPCPG